MHRMSLKTDDPNHFAHQYNDSEKDKKRIRILDSTLREGEQHPGVSFSIKQRIQIVLDVGFLWRRSNRN